MNVEFKNAKLKLPTGAENGAVASEGDKTPEEDKSGPRSFDAGGSEQIERRHQERKRLNETLQDAVRRTAAMDANPGEGR